MSPQQMGISKVLAALTIAIFGIPWGFSLIGADRSVVVGCLALIVGMACILYIVWVWEPMTKLHVSIRSLLTIAVVALIVGFAWSPLSQQLHAQTRAPQDKSGSNPNEKDKKKGTDQPKVAKRTDSGGKGTPPSPGNNNGTVGTFNAAPCTVNQIGGAGNRGTVNCGPPKPLILTSDQQEQFGRDIRSRVGQRITLMCFSKGCDSMASLSGAFKLGLWQPDTVGSGISTMDPGPLALMSREVPPGVISDVKKGFSGLGISLSEIPWNDRLVAPLMIARPEAINNIVLLVGTPQ